MPDPHYQSFGIDIGNITVVYWVMPDPHYQSFGIDIGNITVVYWYPKI